MMSLHSILETNETMSPPKYVESASELNLVRPF